MSDFKERVHAAIQKNPALAAFLKDFCARSFKTGELPKRCTFRNVDLSVIADLRLIFGARAVKARDENVVFDLAAVGLASLDARQELLQTLTEVLVMKRQNRRLQQQRTHANLAQRLQALAPLAQSPLAQKVHQRLIDDLVQQRGYLWREGVLKGQGPAALLQIEAVLNALHLVATNAKGWNFAELGARVTGSSKSFRPGGELYRLAADWALPFLDESEPLVQIEDLVTRRARVWEQLGVEPSGAAITVMAGGPLVYARQGKIFSGIEQHFDMGEPSTLSLTQLMGIERIEPLFDTILTIENLTPFIDAVQRQPLPRALMIYTEGFPNRAVRMLLQLCREQITGLKFLHWGDTDLAGVRILRNLASTMGEVPALFRCGPKDIAKHQARLIRLTPEQRENIKRDLNTHPQAPGREILEAVLHHDGWLEQEAWESKA
ncbi:DUF2220 family protein [candidate division KSB1 bacterium]|nr:DUF2220 family protein [candidate division KSB1 bacterium]